MQFPKPRFNSGFKDWQPSQLPDLSDKTYVITGSNSGIGFEAAKMLGEAGGNIILACRNQEKAAEAQKQIAAVSNGFVDVVSLDLADLSSVRQASEYIHKRVSSLDGLINNAGIMQTPEQRTKDGFEMQFGTNHLGHFLLTGLLFDLLEAGSGRIVVLSSVVHKLGSINFSDVMAEQSYSSSFAYIQSKFANLMFAMDLDRKLKEKNSTVQCIACHPGYADTNLQSTGPTGLFNYGYKVLNALFAQSMKKGATPTVLCAAGTEARAGGYYGPVNLFESRGRISDANVARGALDEQNAARLWELSEKYVDLIWQP